MPSNIVSFATTCYPGCTDYAGFTLSETATARKRLMLTAIKLGQAVFSANSEQRIEA